MKTALVTFALLALVAAAAKAQSPLTANRPVRQIETGTYVITDRGPHHRVWERTDYETTPAGNRVPRVHRFRELASGLHYWNGAQNTWMEAKEEIVSVPGGAEATQGQHRVFFPYDLAQGIVHLVTPDGQHIKSQPLCLSYSDGTNSVVIASLAGSAPGQISGSNQVIYATAFTNSQGQPFKADVVYVYKKGSLEQDIVLRQQPPTPEALGISSENAKLEVITEFFPDQAPAVVSGSLRTEAGNIDSDQISFGVLQMGLGKAFVLGTNSPAIPVGKKWLRIDGRQLLIEQIPVSAIADALAGLPLAQTRATGASKLERIASSKRTFPWQRSFSGVEKRKLEIAKNDGRPPGVVIDYITVNTTGSYLFSSDTTYYISANVYSTGVLTYEGGSVSKYAPNTSVTVNDPGSVQMISTNYRPVVFTAKDDDSIGEKITGSSGSPASYGTAIAFNGSNLSGSALSLSNFRISYAGTAVSVSGISVTVTLADGQIVNCSTGFTTPGQVGVGVNNVLFSKFSQAFVGSYMNVQPRNCTFDGNLFDPPNNYAPSFLLIPTANPTTASLNAVNCVLANLTYFANDPSRYNGDHNGFYYCGPDRSSVFGSSYSTSANNPFRVAAGGKYYLNDATFRGVGTVSIDSSLLADLRTKTTYPPIVYTDMATPAGTLGPQAQRDAATTSVDLGFHYPQLDYVFAGCTAGANMVFAAGTAAGWSVPSSGYAAISFQSSVVAFQGTQASPDYWVRANTVQENDTGTEPSIGAGLSGFGNGSSVIARFTRFSQMAGDLPPIMGDLSFATVANDCEFYGGILGDTETVQSINLTNCLLFRVGIGLGCSCYAPLNLLNCTMRGGRIGTSYYGMGIPLEVTIRDSAFDQTSFSFNLGSAPNSVDMDYNAFSPADASPSGQGVHDPAPLVSFNWQAGPLGNSYLPSDTPLHDAGSRLPADAGLLDFTTQTSESPERSKTLTEHVDIAYHYVALDGDRKALDANNDGIPDWWEDFWGLPVGISDGLHAASADPDGDGLSNLQEYQQGSNPVHPENLVPDGTYKTLNLASALATKAYDVYYRGSGSTKWRRISSVSPGQKSLTVLNPNPAAEGDYIFLDAADGDGDGLSNGYEDWFAYTPGAGVVSACAPRSTGLTCPNRFDSDFDTMVDGWKVAHALNPMSTIGIDGAGYVLPGDTLNNRQKHDAYFAALNASQSGYANYDPLNLTSSASVRPVMTLSQLAANASNIATFTISRDVGSGGLASPLTIYYAVGGTLQYGSDYILIPAPTVANGVFSAQIPAGQPAVTITAVLTPSAIAQGAASLILTLTPYSSVQ